MFLQVRSRAILWPPGDGGGRPRVAGRRFALSAGNRPGVDAVGSEVRVVDHCPDLVSHHPLPTWNIYLYYAGGALILLFTEPSFRLYKSIGIGVWRSGTRTRIARCTP